MYKSFDDRQRAGSSRSGGFYSPKEEESDLSDLGFLATGAFLLYLFHAISMASVVEGRKKRSDIAQCLICYIQPRIAGNLKIQAFHQFRFN